MDYTDSEDISLEKNGEDPNGYDNEYEGKKVFMVNCTYPGQK